MSTERRRRKRWGLRGHACGAQEFARLTNPNQNVAIIGTRDCTYNHQQVSVMMGLQALFRQEIEALTQGHVERGHRIYTSGSSGTNSAVIKAVLNQGRRLRYEW